MLGLALLAIGGNPPRSAAQIISGTNGIGGAGNYDGPGNFGFSGLGNTPIQVPRQGSWAEILSVSPKGWLVLQDGEGRQYPVWTDSITLFLIRWPTTLAQVEPGSLAEVTGVDLGTNLIGAEHADIYEGKATNLVTPTVQNLVGFNRVITAYDVDQMNTYGARYFLLPGEEQIPSRTHIVGQVVGSNPLQISAGGNLSLGVVSGPGGMSVSRITPGTPGLVQRGDLVYFMADEATPKSLVLSELVVYKK